MVQTVVRYCDQHILNDEEVSAAGWEITFKAPASRPQVFEVDFCPDCSKPLHELIEHLVEIARQAKAPSRERMSGEGPFAGEGPFECVFPDCAGSSYANGASFRAHMRQVHNLRAKEYANYLVENSLVAKPDFSCPKCGAIMVNQKSLRGHVKNMHGTTLAELTGTLLNHPCPDCERRFGTGTGVSSHRRTSHGLNMDGTPATPVRRKT